MAVADRRGKIKLKSSDKHEDETPKMTDEGMELKNKVW